MSGELGGCSNVCYPSLEMVSCTTPVVVGFGLSCNNNTLDLLLFINIKKGFFW